MGFLAGLRNFFGEVRSEFARVSWPTREATLKSTGIVVFVTLVLAIYMGVLDVALAEVVKRVLS